MFSNFSPLHSLSHSIHLCTTHTVPSTSAPPIPSRTPLLHPYCSVRLYTCPVQSCPVPFCTSTPPILSHLPLNPSCPIHTPSPIPSAHLHPSHLYTFTHLICTPLPSRKNLFLLMMKLLLPIFHLFLYFHQINNNPIYSPKLNGIVSIVFKGTI